MVTYDPDETTYIGAAKRLAVERGGLTDWFVGVSPRNGFGALAEGYWCHWVHLARLILAHDLTRERMPEFHVGYEGPSIYAEHHPACTKGQEPS